MSPLTCLSPRRAPLVLGALAAALLLCAAPSAYADQREIEEDDIKMTSQGFDFGTGSFTAGAPLGSGRVEWLVDENDLTPVLLGDLILNNVEDECARMRIDYYTAGGGFLITKYGMTHCANDDGRHDWNVHMSPHTSDKIGKVKVTLEHELENGSWGSVEHQWSRLSTYIDDDYVQIERSDSGFSFGGSGWNSIAQQASGSAQVEWEFSEGQIRPHVTGTLQASNAAGECARMRIDYYADEGELGLGPADTNTYNDYLHTVYGGEVCANDDSHEPWSVDRRDYSDRRIRQVTIALETLDDGTWTTSGSRSSMFGT